MLTDGELLYQPCFHRREWAWELSLLAFACCLQVLPFAYCLLAFLPTFVATTSFAVIAEQKATHDSLPRDLLYRQDLQQVDPLGIPWVGELHLTLGRLLHHNKDRWSTLNGSGLPQPLDEFARVVLHSFLARLARRRKPGLQPIHPTGFVEEVQLLCQHRLRLG